MRGMVIDATERLVTEICCSCSVLFAMPEALRNRRKDDGSEFYCPNGHSQHFSESTVTRLEREKKELARQVEKERSDKAWYIGRLNTEQTSHKHTSAQLRGTKAVVTRFKKRIVAGRCPCCSHQFKDLERHMKNQHPSFDPEKAADAIAARETSK